MLIGRFSLQPERKPAMKNKSDNPLTTDPPTETSELELSDRLKAILVALNAAFEAARAGKSGKKLYLTSEAVKEQSGYFKP
jgi:hypothetical protein